MKNIRKFRLAQFLENILVLPEPTGKVDNFTAINPTEELRYRIQEGYNQKGLYSIKFI